MVVLLYCPVLQDRNMGFSSPLCTNLQYQLCMVESVVPLLPLHLQLSVWGENPVMFDLGCKYFQFHYLGCTQLDQWMDSSVFDHRAQANRAVRPVAVQLFCLVWSMGYCCSLV